MRQQGTRVKKIFQSLVSVHCHGARRKGVGPGKVAGRERICGQWSTHRRLDSTQCTRGACTVDAWCTHGACAVHARCMRSATCPAPRNIQTPFPPLKLDPNCVPSKARLAVKVGKWGGGHVNPPLKVACRKPPLTSPQGVLKRTTPAGQPPRPHEFVGTMSAMAPEMGSKTPHGQPIDLWGVGFVALELITLKGIPNLGWRVTSETDVVKVLKTELNLTPEDLEPWTLDLLWQTVKSLLCHDPADRPTAQALFHKLNNQKVLDVLLDAASGEIFGESWRVMLPRPTAATESSAEFERGLLPRPKKTRCQRCQRCQRQASALRGLLLPCR